MKNKSSYFILGAGICLFAALTFFSETFASGVSKGLEYCAKLLIPSVFPFIVAASLTGRGTLPQFFCRILNPVTEFFFGLPAQCTCNYSEFLRRLPFGCKICSEPLFSRNYRQRNGRAYAFFLHKCRCGFFC